MKQSKSAGSFGWVLLGAFVLVILLFAAALLVVWWTRPTSLLSEPPTAVVRVIPFPTPSPTPVAPTAAAPKTVTPPVESSSTSFPLGSYVQVSGTGGDGLRLRTEPGLNSQIRALGDEGEIFQVRDGPRQADAYLWWYLVAAEDESRNGWAVGDFLSMTSGP